MARTRTWIGALTSLVAPASMPAWATLAVAGLVGAAESGAVIQSTTPGEAFPTSAVFGIGRLTSPLSTASSTLRAWALLARTQPGLESWLLWHLGFSFLFLAGYFLLGIAILGVLAREETPVAAEITRARQLTTGRCLLMATGAAHLALIAAAVLCTAGWIGYGHDPGTAWAVVLQVLVVVTWAAGLWFAAWICYRALDHAAAARHLAQAVKIQRFSLVIAVLLIVVAILPGTNTLEQMPDVQRAWIGHAGFATAAFLAAIAAQLLLALVMFHIGRLRIRRARQQLVAPAEVRGRPSYRGWITASGAFLLLALILWILGQARVGWTVAVIPGVLTAVALVSWLADDFPEHLISLPATLAALPGKLAALPGKLAAMIERVWRWLAPHDKTAPADSAQADDAQADDAAGVGQHLTPADGLVRTVQALGDGLAIAVLAIPGLGLVRSFTTPALVGTGSYAWYARAAVLVGLALATLSWPLARWVSHAFRPSSGAEAEGAPVRPALMYASVLIYAGAVVWLLRWPLQASARLGVVATATIALGALAMVLALLAHLAQNRAPLPVFSILRLKSTPVLSILAIIGIIGLSVGQSSQLHRISTQSSGPGVISRPSLLQQLTTWLNTPDLSCAPDLARANGAPAVQVRPLVLVAAAGGGIRAAWWTAGALTLLADNDCGRESVFAVSGVSGGSLGTAVVATAAGHGSSLRASVTAVMNRLAEPSALASGIDGLVLRDTVAGLTGMTLRAADMHAGPDFPDRAALIEQTWMVADPALDEPFLARPADTVPWQLLFNSTAVRSSCRAIVATAAVGPPAAPAQQTPGCPDISGQPSRGYDLPDAYDLFAQLPCLQQMSVATAAMLSARFAYITPSGSVPGCEGDGYRDQASQQVEQYIDGGYADSSGLVTLADIMPALLPLIARHNAAQLAAAGTGPVTLVAPVVAYLANTPIVKPVTPEELLPQAAEPMIPITASSSASGQLNGQTTLLQRLASDVSPGQWLPCAAGDSRCASAAHAAGTIVGSGIIVIAPRQLPGAFAVPLGWVLSQASEQSLTTDLSIEATYPCNSQHIYCSPGTQDLHGLLWLTRPRPPTK